MVNMLCAKYGFAQSMDCPAQSSNRYFAQQSTSVFLVLATVPVLLQKVISTCAVKIKWPLSMRLQDLLLQEIEVLLFQVLASS